MAFEVKKGPIQVAGEAIVKVIAVNPTVKEAEKAGIALKEDTKWDKEKPRLDVYLEVQNQGFKCRTKMAIFLKDIPSGTNGGFASYIDETGANGNQDFLKGDKIRVAREGEGQLASLIVAWTNNSSVDKEDIDAIYKGDLTGLKSLVELASDNTFKVAVAIRFVEKDGNVNGYMDVYPYKFARSYNQNFKTQLVKAATKNGKWFQERWFPADWNITLYNGQTLADKATSVTPDDGDLFTEEEAVF